ncbi:MAG: hypothetical protein IKQ10_02990 [Oscillospiraceae bacterium]|nr:hypothetical protein [Oscillospiraceae bacterium]
MSLAVLSVLFSAAFVLAVLLSMTLKPAFFSRFVTVSMAVVVVGGLIYYGFGYYEISRSLLLTVLRTPVFVFRMFVGINELSAIAGTRLVSTAPGLAGFWLLHLLAFFSVASAALNTLGAEALRQLRYFLSRRGDLTLIYGINDKSIALGRECLATGKSSVVFVAESAKTATINDLNYIGMSVLIGPAAVRCDQKVLRRLHIGSRTLTVYAIDEASDSNLFFALRLKNALEGLGVPAENTRVTLPGAEDIITSMLQVSEEQYGFGYVNVFDASDLSARALIRLCPPWESIAFSPDGRAKEDYECVIVGFGAHGQAVLKQLVMNGQFAGARFRAEVFSPNFQKEAGYLIADSPELLHNYEIHSVEADARGSDFYSYIQQRLSTLKLIVVCTGDEERNREISDNLMLYLQRRRAENICVVRCGDTGVRYQESVGSPILTMNIYTRAFLSAEDADRNAIILNAVYDDSDRSDWEKWVACPSFSKMSSRASAEFLPAFIRAAGSSRAEMLAGDWHPSQELLVNLGQTEHLRWNAFHFANGYRTMTPEEFNDNAATWRRCQEAGLPCNIKISKNTEERTHACLVSWDELDELSARESAVTGRSVDYKQYDINNVLALPRLLRAGEESAG